MGRHVAVLNQERANYHIGKSYQEGIIADIISYGSGKASLVITSHKGNRRVNLKRITRHKWREI